MIRKLFTVIALATLACTHAHASSVTKECSINVVTSPKVINGAIFNAQTFDGSYGTDTVVFYDMYKLNVPCYRFYKISATPMREKSNNDQTHGKYKYKKIVYLNQDSSVSVIYPEDFPDAPK